MLKLLTPRQEQMIISNVVKACKDIRKLSNVGYKFINLCGGFIAHYDRRGFIAYYDDDHYGHTLWGDIMKNAPMNQWSNFRPGEQHYEYYMQKKKIYNAICERIR